MFIGPLVRRFFCAILGEPRAQYLMNRWLMYFWIVNLAAVHLVFFFAPGAWQKVSILYLADISVYACIGQHYTGLVAAMGSENAASEPAGVLPCAEENNA